MMWLCVIKHIPPEDQDRGWRSRYSDKAAVSRNCGSIPGRGKKFVLISKVFIPAVGFTHPQNQSKHYGEKKCLVAVGDQPVILLLPSPQPRYCIQNAIQAPFNLLAPEFYISFKQITNLMQQFFSLLS
jgi:hypothetical protein